jgi:hypothetical protein
MTKLTPRIRIDAIISVLKSAGRINKEALTTRVAEILKTDKETLHKPLYRDLDKLVNENKIAVERFDKDGIPIENWDPEIHRVSRSEWYIPDTESYVMGFKLLEQFNIKHKISKRIQRAIIVEQSLANLSSDYFHMLFSIGNEVLRLSLKKDDAPFNLIFSRLHGEISNEEALTIKELVGERHAILKIPLVKLSSYKNKLSAGHGVIKFDGEKNSLEVQDLNSTNGTYIQKLTPSFSEGLLPKISMLGKKTSRLTWDEILTTQHEPEKIEGVTKKKIQLPCIVYLSPSFKILFI